MDALHDLVEPVPRSGEPVARAGPFSREDHPGDEPGPDEPREKALEALRRYLESTLQLREP